MGSPSVLVLIGSHSLCNSFVVMRSNESNMVGKKYFVYFLLAKYTPMSRKNGGQKGEWRYPTACVGSTSYQTKIFRHI